MWALRNHKIIRRSIKLNSAKDWLESESPKSRVEFVKSWKVAWKEKQQKKTHFNFASIFFLLLSLTFPFYDSSGEEKSVSSSRNVSTFFYYHSALVVASLRELCLIRKLTYCVKYFSFYFIPTLSPSLTFAFAYTFSDLTRAWTTYQQ